MTELSNETSNEIIVNETKNDILNNETKNDILNNEIIVNETKNETSDKIDKATKRKQHAKEYYLLNKERIIKHNNNKRNLIINSDVYKAKQRDDVIEQLNNGSKKWITEATKIKLNIQQCPKTLKYF